ncbi:unnamed protein product [Arctia plantaginis]|uniref:Uncharacterized protein n=1 Tax=Arctia plantaginis TaxID=874455 RepID=A0A8S1AQR6_ARCPL|nr:unnamed protein product [Arctia plantaginis]CAB3249383.1 unnamed protein product [Arctia plantaginis]
MATHGAGARGALRKSVRAASGAVCARLCATPRSVKAPGRVNFDNTVRCPIYRYRSDGHSNVVDQRYDRKRLTHTPRAPARHSPLHTYYNVLPTGYLTQNPHDSNIYLARHRIGLTEGSREVPFTMVNFRYRTIP